MCRLGYFFVAQIYAIGEREKTWTSPHPENALKGVLFVWTGGVASGSSDVHL